MSVDLKNMTSDDIALLEANVRWRLREMRESVQSGPFSVEQVQADYHRMYSLYKRLYVNCLGSGLAELFSERELDRGPKLERAVFKHLLKVRDGVVPSERARV